MVWIPLACRALQIARQRDREAVFQLERRFANGIEKGHWFSTEVIINLADRLIPLEAALNFDAVFQNVVEERAVLELFNGLNNPYFSDLLRPWIKKFVNFSDCPDEDYSFFNYFMRMHPEIAVRAIPALTELSLVFKTINTTYPNFVQKSCLLQAQGYRISHLLYKTKFASFYEMVARGEAGRYLLKLRHEHRHPEQLILSSEMQNLISHPNILPVKFTGFEGEYGYQIFEMAGTSLEQLKGLLQPPTILSIFHGVGLALSELHRHGVIHGDIKPSNILYDKDKGRVSLIDFDASRKVDDKLTPNILMTKRYFFKENFHNSTLIIDLIALTLCFFDVLFEKIVQEELRFADFPCVNSLKKALDDDLQVWLLQHQQYADFSAHFQALYDWMFTQPSVELTPEKWLLLLKKCAVN